MKPSMILLSSQVIVTEGFSIHALFKLLIMTHVNCNWGLLNIVAICSVDVEQIYMCLSRCLTRGLASHPSRQVSSNTVQKSISWKSIKALTLNVFMIVCVWFLLFHFVFFSSNQFWLSIRKQVTFFYQHHWW